MSSNPNKTRNSVKVKNIQNYLANAYERLWAHYVETADECYYLLNGVKVSTEEMDILHPVSKLESNAIEKGTGLDSRTNWIK